MVYSVGEMAKQLGVTPSTLRYYDKEGLLPFVSRTKGGIRQFKDSDYEWLQVIECLKKTGMQLKDIKQFILMAMDGDDTIDQRLELIIKQQQYVRQQIADMQQTLDTLDFKRWYYETAREAGSTSVPRNMSLEEIPEKYRETRKRLRKE
ncbi:MAG: MerR family transcriptional regulator [Ruminococcaceae bacterium]|nr:MerR family transcriptional regulator [Oscillospiraceae bacterium]